MCYVYYLSQLASYKPVELRHYSPEEMQSIKERTRRFVEEHRRTTKATSSGVVPATSDHDNESLPPKKRKKVSVAPPRATAATIVSVPVPLRNPVENLLHTLLEALIDFCDALPSDLSTEERTFVLNYLKYGIGYVPRRGVTESACLDLRTTKMYPDDQDSYLSGFVLSHRQEHYLQPFRVCAWKTYLLTP
jgi:hypothetical protein